MIQLPPEILLLILGSPSTLSVLDLARLCIVHPDLAPLARTAAKKHRLRRILLACFGFVPQDVLSIQAWSEAKGIDRIERIWDCLVNALEYGIVNDDIIHLANLFSRFSSWTYRKNLGFPQLRSGSLPSIGNSAKGSEDPDGSRSVDAAKDHRLFLFSNAVVYAALRALSRRGRMRQAVGQHKEVKEYEHLDPPAREAKLHSEFETLRAALLRCDPFSTHVERLRRPRRSRDSGESKEGGLQARTLASTDADEWDCACFDRSWATWYLAAWQHLSTRYRRFTSHDDISHVAYRTILTAVPSFPTGTQLPPSSSSGSPPLNDGGTTASRERRDPLLLSSHLNPDSMLFSLQESKTFALTKSLYNLTEHALAPGMARLWAGNVGYAWGEGGSLWLDESRRNAERRLSESMRGLGAHPSPPTPSSRLETSDGVGDEKVSAVSMQEGEPIHSVLLAHARWRARVFLRWLRATDERGRGADTPAGDEQPDLTMLEKARSFDIHFVRRALQIQQWAGLDTFHSVVAAQRRGAATAPAAAVDAGAGSHSRAAPMPSVQVHPSSPFLAFERTGEANWNRQQRKRNGRLYLLFSRGKGQERAGGDESRHERDRIEEAGWKAILAPLASSFPPFPSPVANDDGDVRSAATALRKHAFQLLGDLHEGLIHPSLLSGPTTLQTASNSLCLERFDRPRSLTSGPGSESEPDRSTDRARTNVVFLSDASPPGAPDAHPFLVRGFVDEEERWADDLTLLWPGTDGRRGATELYRRMRRRCDGSERGGAMRWNVELFLPRRDRDGGKGAVLVGFGAVMCLLAVVLAGRGSVVWWR